MDLMNLVDVSPFLLFESTGDSDQVEEELLGGSSSDLPTTMDIDDDAESCSYDEWDCSCCCVGYDDDLDECDEHGEVEVEEEGEEEPPPSGCVDSAEEVVMMNEMEKSRLFWETCLAS